MRRLEKPSSAKALAASLPRISSATRLSLRGLTRTVRATARASLSFNFRGRDGLPMILLLGPRRLPVGRVAVEDAGRRELAEFVANHVFGDEDGKKLMAVIDAEGEPDELRQDGRAPRPNLDDLVAAGSPRLLRLFEEVAIDK